MKQKNLFILSLALVAVAGAGLMASSSAYASEGETQQTNRTMRGNEQRMERAERPNDETRATIREALENGDYEAWKQAVGNRPILDKITQENFSKFSEAHTLKMQGDNEGARAIMEELGVNGGFGKGAGRHFGNMIEKKGMHFKDANGDGVCDNLDLDGQ